MNQKEVILFVSLGPYAFEQQLATALYLASQSAFRPHFLLIAKEDYTFIDRLESAGISYNTLGPFRKVSAASCGTSSRDSRKTPALKIRSLPTRARQFAHRLPGFFLFRLLFFACKLWFGKRMAHKYVQQLKPHCAVVSQERQEFFLPVLRALKQFRVPIILMPVAESSPDGSAWPRRKSYLLKAGLNKSSAATDISPYPHLVGRGIAMLNRKVHRWLPSQVYDSPWGKILFYPAAQVFLLKMMGMLPRNPWYQGTTFADYIMISGIDESAMYAEAKIASDKLLFIGSHELDVLHDCWLDRMKLRETLVADYHLNPNQKILIVALPQLWEQGMVSKEEHWQSINDILAVLANQVCNVLISLHPRSSRDNYNWIEDKYPVKICREPLKDILAISDIFVASYSSTIRWAIGLGIPVINLDFWQFNIKVLRNLTGYQTITTLTGFHDLVQKLASTTQSNRVDGRPIASGDEPHILVDGRAKERLKHFIESLDSNTSVPEVPSEHTASVL